MKRTLITAITAALLMTTASDAHARGGRFIGAALGIIAGAAIAHSYSRGARAYHAPRRVAAGPTMPTPFRGVWCRVDAPEGDLGGTYFNRPDPRANRDHGENGCSGDDYITVDAKGYTAWQGESSRCTLLRIANYNYRYTFLAQFKCRAEEAPAFIVHEWLSFPGHGAAGEFSINESDRRFN
jgi:hypothetical protein